MEMSSRVNPVAASLIGWNADEARGRPLTEVFNIVNAETGEKALNPVRTVMEQGRVAGLANHTHAYRQRWEKSTK